MTNATAAKKIPREARLKTVPIPEMKVNPLAQREVNPARVSKIAADLDIEQLGTPTVSYRDGHYYIIDGQHRIEALKVHGYGDQRIQCWCYEDLSEEDEAEMFLKLNDVLSVNAFSKFRVGLQAGRPDEVEIDQVVRANGLRISLDEVEGAIKAVGTLRRVHARCGPTGLGRTLRIIRDAYGDYGFIAQVLDGLGHLTHRYNGDLDDTYAIGKLSKAHGGVAGLLNRAENIHRSTGNPKAQCVAAAAVDIINANTRGNKRLSNWWRDAS